MKTKRPGVVLLIMGGVITLGGFITSVVYVFQPWRACDYDDTPSACSMLPGDAAVLMLALLATVLGACVVLAGIVVRILKTDRAPRALIATSIITTELPKERGAHV